jgi:hypothetical protein
MCPLQTWSKTQPCSCSKTPRSGSPSRRPRGGGGGGKGERETRHPCTPHAPAGLSATRAHVERAPWLRGARRVCCRALSLLVHMYVYFQYTRTDIHTYIYIFNIYIYILNINENWTRRLRRPLQVRPGGGRQGRQRAAGWIKSFIFLKEFLIFNKSIQSSFAHPIMIIFTGIRA